MGIVRVVVGGQYGSEAKGAVTARLMDVHPESMNIRVAGPNAGHSGEGVLDNEIWALRTVPIGAVRNTESPLVIAPGSEIDLEVLHDEVTRLDAAGYRVSERLHISRTATLITQHDRDQEAEMVGRIGSTGKGIGAARANRLMRTAELYGERPWSCDGAKLINWYLEKGGDVLIEGTQGYGLGLHGEHYPQCTSSDCRSIDFMAMAGIPPRAPWVEGVKTWVVLRTYPIRVAGNSGYMKDETSWDELAQTTKGYVGPEYTTVTKKMRRVGAWDRDLAVAAVRANGGEDCDVALMFFDYWYPELAGAKEASDLEEKHWLTLKEKSEEVGAKIRMVGTGPRTQILL